MFNRCMYCRRIIWPFPWVHHGWHVRHDGRVYWHARCHRDLRIHT